MIFSPTQRQQDIIDEDANCVVVAVPGSGKTFTISQKIKKIIQTLPDYKGVIAISYTNKASDELNERCLSEGEYQKNSFFGTIDKFFLTEIIIPFGIHLFGLPQNEIEVVTARDAGFSEKEANDFKINKIDKGAFQKTVELYRNGKIVLDILGFFATQIYKRSRACRQYLGSRYSHIFVDEYQDCDYWQHTMFKELVALGLKGIAVGDLNQSIFAFAGKDSRYLEELRSDSENYKIFALSDNHRCHNSIVNYSSCLISSNVELLPTEELRIIHKNVVGSEIHIAKWLASNISELKTKYDVRKNSDIAVLVSKRPTGAIISEHIAIPHKPIIDTALDSDSSIWGVLFKKILLCILDEKETKYKFLENYFDLDAQGRNLPEIVKHLQKLEGFFQSCSSDYIECFEIFVKIALVMFPQNESSRSLNNLKSVLKSDIQVSSFLPPSDNEVQILTLHKSKGLEFDLVFHLDLYEWILPKYKGNRNQCRNLHYVGITRAKKCCVLCTSTIRHKANKTAITAEISPFLRQGQLPGLRIDI